MSLSQKTSPCKRAPPALHGGRETMDPPLGPARLLGHASSTLRPVGTKTLENPQALVPQAHGGLFAEG
jgi:hypothetical protein